MTNAIEIKNLGKKYKIGTSNEGVSTYKSMREGLTDSIKGLFRKSPSQPENKASEFWALHDLNLTIQKGERVGIIGRNGAGKSTLLKLISRITHPSTGEITFNGRVASLLEVGTGFHPELTGRENIFLNGAVMGMSHQEITRKFDEIVEFAGVEKFLDTPVKRYSSGMYTRLAFSVAAHLEGEILIVDEVLAVGDAEFQKKCLGKMEEIGKTHGRTVLFVSHNMNAMRNFCNRIIWLDKGKVVEDSYDIGLTTRNYLQSGLTETAVYWKASDSVLPSSPYFEALEFYVGNSEGQPLELPSIENDEEAYIYIKFKVEETESALVVGYGIYKEDGELLYISFQNDQPESAWPDVQVGINTFCSRFPSRMLNEGSYRIELLASLHRRYWILEPDKTAPAIHLKIQGGLSDSPLWIGRRQGIIAPELSWKKVL